MAQIFNRETIMEFSNPLSEEVASNVISWTQDTLKTAIDEIRQTNPIITDFFDFELAGDFITDTTTINSEIDLYVVLKSPQLELNSIKLANNKAKQFWLRIKRAWSMTREEKMSKRKRKKKLAKMQEEVIIPPNKYSMSDFKMSLLKKLILKVDENSYVIVTSTGLKLVAREFLGIDVNIYPVIKSGDTYKVYNEHRGRFIESSFNDLKHNYTEKTENVGELYNDMVRVYKNLFFNLYNYHASRFFIESLIYNCPDSLFEGYDFFEVFIKILNYLKNAGLENFMLITDKEKKLFSSREVNESIITVINMVKLIDNML